MEEVGRRATEVPRSVDSKSEDECEEESARKFAAGDLVWGPVRGHASWPGALAARAPRGRWRVRWFGDFGPRGLSAPLAEAQLLSLSEGLEAHHAARTKHRK